MGIFKDRLGESLYLVDYLLQKGARHSAKDVEVARNEGARRILNLIGRYWAIDP